MTSPITKATAPTRAFQSSLEFDISPDESSYPPPHIHAHNNGAALAPAARILSSTTSAMRKQHNSRSLNDYQKPPSLVRSSFSAQSAAESFGPRTPTETRPMGFGARGGSLQQSVGFTPMLQNQAEMDAVDSLLFMSSPNNSNSMKKSSQHRPGLERQGSGKKVNFLLD